MAWFPTFAESLLARLAARAVEGLVRGMLKNGIPTPRWMYFRSLCDSLAPMPFLYRDVELATMDAFVELELDEIMPGKIFPKRRSRAPHLDRPLFQRVRDTRRGLFIGQAGIGKTTLFRYSVLSVATNSGAGQYLNPDRLLVPVLVPLKALSNSSSSPILRYILDNNPYFQGRWGHWRLRRLAKKSRLFLFLDGYDEIPIAGSSDYIVQELEALFANEVPKALFNFQTSPYRKFYADFLGCRVWLSSRREFFNANPLAIGAGSNVWAVAGIGRHRAELVERIFQRHISTEPHIWTERLSSERFMQQLLVVAEGSLEELSNNPLFLTIMCFVYVYDLRDQRNPQDVWRGGVDAIIDRCIEALLFDVDESKARGLPAVQREALLHRRASWRDEKLTFLEYLAGVTLLENLSVITQEAAIERAMEFFSRRADEQSSADILRNLSSVDGSVNLVIQIIYSGLLVLVEKAKERSYYDFPHRRFKEVLGRRYLESRAGCALICSRIAERHLAEFILLYFRDTRWRSEIVAALVTGMSNGDANTTLRLAGLLADCLEQINNVNVIQCQVAVTRVLKELEEHVAGRALPVRLIELVPLSAECVQYLEATFLKAINEQKHGLLRYVATPLQQDPNAFRRAILYGYAAQRDHTNAIARELVQLCTTSAPDVLERALAEWKDDRSRELLSILYAANLNASAHHRPIVQAAILSHQRMTLKDWQEILVAEPGLATAATMSAVQERHRREESFDWLASEKSAIDKLRLAGAER
jgi:hypothetical protein